MGLFAVIIAAMALVAAIVGTIVERRSLRRQGYIGPNEPWVPPVPVTGGQRVWEGEDEFDIPEHQIVVWTPLEREALGINDTLKLIDRIGKELDLEEKQRQQREENERRRLGIAVPTTATPRLADEDYEVAEVHSFGSPVAIRTYRTGGPAVADLEREVVDLHRVLERIRRQEILRGRI